MAASPKPARYAAIRDELQDHIVSGRWPPGHRVPPEHELMAQFGCSRMTVSRALSALSAAGLIIRKRRAGTMVALRTVEETMLEIHDIPVEIAALGRAYRHEVLASQQHAATGPEASRLGIAAGSPVLALQCRHLGDNVPFVLENRLINLAAVPMAAATDFTRTPPGTWLLSHIHWSKAEHQISAINATTRIAFGLAVQKGAACLMVTRRTWQNGVPITAVDLVYPGERHRLKGQFSPLNPFDAMPDSQG